MYRFMTEMSPRRQKMLFAAGVYVLWSLAYGLAAAIFSLSDEDISFFSLWGLLSRRLLTRRQRRKPG